ncbi:MAG: inverse autotransporter beta domain-containing protein [Chlamydiales bacterium]|nr:inverse autotransporter beta domain-containing protein [Chlamydiales bacterium]
MKSRLLMMATLTGIHLFSNPCIQGSASHVEIGTRQGKGMGYEHGYTTAGLFLTPNWQRNFQPILDGRVHFLNNATWASNLGGGLRFGLPSDFALGGNFFYDFRSAKHIAAHQLGMGLELLHSLFDVTVNGYLPIGTTKSEGSIKFDQVVGYHIFLKQRIAFALPHIEAMAGFWFPSSWPIDLYWAAGPYYLFGRNARIVSCKSSLGAKTFLEARLYDGFILGGQWTYDNEYHGRLQGYLGFSFPLGPSNIPRGGHKWKSWYSPECQSAATKQRLLTSPIRRDEIIPVRVKQDKPLPLSILPSVPDPAPPCYFVNNSLATNGDGTFENPFNNLASAEAASAPGDCIYVYFGTGSTAPGYDTGFVLKDGQMFSGSGFDFIIDGVNVLPAQTPGQSPFISGAPAVTLADHTMVNGFNFDNTDAIFGNGIAGGQVSNSTFNNINFPDRALNIRTATEDFVITNNLFENINVAVDVADFFSGSLIISNNSFFAPNATNDVLRLRTADEGTILFENNIIDARVVAGSVDLFEIRTANSASNLIDHFVFRNNDITFTSATGFGRFFEYAALGIGSTQFIFENNNVTYDLPTGVFMEIVGPLPFQQHLMNAQVTNNVINNPNAGAPGMITFGLENECVNIDGNALTNTEIFLFIFGPFFFEASPGSAALMSAANSGAPVSTFGAVNFNATLPSPPCL